MTLNPKTTQGFQKLKQTLEKMSESKGKFAGASREFQTRYFSWCLKECKAEAQRNFGLVRMVRDISSCIFIDYIESLPQGHNEEVLISLCKAMHGSESLSLKEIEIYQSYRQHWSMPVSVGGQIVSGLRATSRQLEMQERFLKESPSPRMISRAIRAGLKGIAINALGLMLHDRPSLLAYEKRFGSWYVVTAFEFGRFSQLHYSHAVHANPGGKGETKIFGGISILNWTGIHVDSTWTWVLPDDVDEVVRDVGRICTHFLQQAEDLLITLPH